MELQPIDRPGPMADRCHGAGFGGCQRHKLLIDRVDLVAVAHPDDGFTGDTLEQTVGLLDVTESPAKLAAGGGLNSTAEHLTGQMHSVTDPQNRNPEPE